MKKGSAFNFMPFFWTIGLGFLAITAAGCGQAQPSAHPAGTDIIHLRPAAMQILSEALDDNDPRIRAKAIEVIADTRRMELMPKVLELLIDDFVPVRFSAAVAIGDTGYQPAENAVKHMLEIPDENSRIAAAYAMGKLGSSRYFEFVRRAITDKDPTLRANAAFLLAKIGDKDGLKLLYWALNDGGSDDKVKFVVLDAIARLGDDRIFNKLWAIIYSAYADDRVAGIQAIGALGTAQAIDVLITKLDDDVLEVRLAAAEQLGMLGNKTGEPEVLDVFRKNLTAGLDTEETEQIDARTALAIGRIGTPSLTPFLPKFLTSESKFVRIAAAKAVFQLLLTK
ncbi:MAG: HEAT repeat domain-containing protein [Planctomycetota bacterium]|jgi:HEAT repeat protein